MLELLTVGSGGRGHALPSDEAVVPVNADVGLIAEGQRRDLRQRRAIGSVANCSTTNGCYEGQKSERKNTHADGLENSSINSNQKNVQIISETLDMRKPNHNTL